ncbi:hypothetical protein HIM_07059 [Hirsutella minnesotensis 3608]|uniref:N-acetylgalactosaminide beta-1,3-galactosyltransferase n=1 Tax=Hirsutella minnesotensis 3608 TaxID=1043627 RepID=A0A0F7ZTQ1_9HYPO|nr:hypothetical protein HIM_07059 [Hirsutella minnesotensis 3608]
MINIPRRMRRRVVSVAALLALAACIWYVALPPDSNLRLAVGFNLGRLSDRVKSRTGGRDAWLWRPARHRLDLRSDVGYLIKTGYGTRHRVPEQLRAFARSGGTLGDENRGFVVVGDWTTVNASDGARLGVEVHDAIRMVMETKIGKEWGEHQRFNKYRSMQGAIAAGNEDLALHLGKTYGWELDALKVGLPILSSLFSYTDLNVNADVAVRPPQFIMGMELAYRRLPLKKWYMILDDDTYLVKPSLELLLSHLDPDKPQYIGNAVGDYKGRFAHGGSAVLLSGSAMKALFSRPDVVARAYVNSLDETWGDRLVATTLQKVAVYINEGYSHYFNGERPEMTRIRGDRICSPIVSFHGLREPGAMARAGERLGGVKQPVLCGGGAGKVSGIDWRRIEPWTHSCPQPP